MWLSKKAAGSETERETPARIAEITIGGGDPAAESRGENRSLAVASLGGYCWKPSAGQSALILDCADGASALSGVVQESWPEGLASGEVCIRSGGASITLKNDGRIIVAGDVELTGDLSVTGSVAVAGSMTLNGWPVAVVTL